eukprot:jgi/Ulvmu1/10913/UM007_0090.1
MAQRADDAIRIARGALLVASQAAANSQLLRRLARRDFPLATHIFERARDADGAAPPQTERSTTNSKPDLDSASTAASNPACSVLYGQAIASRGQLAFETSVMPRHLSPTPSKPATIDTRTAPPPADSPAHSAPPIPPSLTPPRPASPRTTAAEPPQPQQTAQLPQAHQPSPDAADHAFPPRESADVAPQSPSEKPVLAAEAPDAQNAASAPLPISIPKRKFRERQVPSSRIGRAAGFAGLGAGLVWGAATDAVTRALGPVSAQQGAGMLSEANAQRLANALCRMRGAALKIGQMMSIQDEDVLPPAVAAALEKVRQQADVMPRHQLEAALAEQLGADWQSRVATFDWEPSAAASIGQVHKATLHDGREIAMKVQYPGVANSIESDVDNLMNLMRLLNVFPRGLYVEEAVAVAKRELALECDYRNEARSQARYAAAMAAAPPALRDAFVVPAVVPELCGDRVLASEWVHGVPVDHVTAMPQDVRDRVGTALLRLTLQELSVWRFMQTDPNWGNFLYDEASGKLALIDFGAAREFPKPFVDEYLQMVAACAREDRAGILLHSQRLGFLIGDEVPEMLDAHVAAGAAVGTPFGTPGVYDFGSHNQLTRRVAALGATMVQHRLTAPPQEAYSLHRRLSGAFLMNMKLKARVPCKALFDEVYEGHSCTEEAAAMFTAEAQPAGVASDASPLHAVAAAGPGPALRVEAS